MSAPIITVEELSKSYVLRHQQQERYTALRDVMANKARSIFRSSGPKATREEFFALRDVSFEVHAGDRVGIIGRNGAGKSTLLKILSRIVAPTKGRITLDGRVASLLEVGTGFHPELSGRENIFLNGAILGMSKAEIKSKFDEIVAFSEVEKFLDTPVKRYSSGMYVRLAFAVAAHLEPEILIVDEVLAVGDAEFQRKCLGKMQDVSGKGRTVLFVSHNMEAVQKLCNKGLLLDQGRLEATGSMEQVVRGYLESHDPTQGHFVIDAPAEPGLPGVLEEITIGTTLDNITAEIPALAPFLVKCRFKINRDLEHFIIAAGISTFLDQAIRTVWSSPRKVGPGLYEATFHFDDVHLAVGQYRITIGLSDHERSFLQSENKAWFEIIDATDKAPPSRIINYRSGLILDQSRVDVLPFG